MPLAAGADEDRFKLLHLDVGMVCTALGLDATAIECAPELTLVNRGAVAEQATGQLLRLTFAANDDPQLHWWQRDKAGSEAKLDYVMALGSRVIPVEVKAGTSGTLKSLHGFVAERGLDVALRINTAPAIIEPIDTATPHGAAKYRLLSLPAYLVEQAPRLLRAMA